MCTLAKPKSHRLLLVAVALMFSAVAQARNQQVVIFGDSFSDTGNQFAVNGIVNEPPYDSLNPFGVATDPYASHNFTNGTTWIELVADELAHPQSAKAALAGGKKAGNYAWGQAPAYAAAGSPAPQPLSAQVASYLANVNHDVSSETLHVVFIGRSDVIDALVLLGGGAPFNVAVERVGLAAAAIQESIDALVSAGANRFLIMNTPNVGLNPSLTSPGGKFIGAPPGDVEVRPHDELVVYGPAQRIAELEARTAGERGERSHSEAIAEQVQRMGAERQRAGR